MFIKDEQIGKSFTKISWQVNQETIEKLNTLPELILEVLYYACREIIRNAKRYGCDPDKDDKNLKISFDYKDELVIIIEDNGKGFGQTGSSKAGSGHGLALHSTMLSVIGGNLEIESENGQYTKTIINLNKLLS